MNDNDKALQRLYTMSDWQEFEDSINLKKLWSGQKNFGEYDKYMFVGNF